MDQTSKPFIDGQHFIKISVIGGLSPNVVVFNFNFSRKERKKCSNFDKLLEFLGKERTLTMPEVIYQLSEGGRVGLERGYNHQGISRGLGPKSHVTTFS
jgi:hypothetical protein